MQLYADKSKEECTIQHRVRTILAVHGCSRTTLQGVRALPLNFGCGHTAQQSCLPEQGAHEARTEHTPAQVTVKEGGDI